ncbi:hypothetical protein D3C71_1916100 [compost metagenome]
MTITRLFKEKLVFGLASFLALTAAYFVSAPSILYVHQPEAPEELLKKSSSIGKQQG